MKRIFSKVIYIIYLAFVLIIIDYFFYCAYINRILNSNFSEKKSGVLPTVKNVDAITMSRLGYVATDKKSCFVNFDVTKKDGYIRIGCFGDSLTYGEEVSDIYDYPSLLQALFIKNGYDNVEVINFGNGWYGFSQAFIIWKYIGLKYNLDYVLLGPVCFQSERDIAFNHTGGRNPYYMHSRFIVENNKLKLIDVIGDTYEERVRGYYGFIPPFRYIRFDNNPPPFLACLLLPGRGLRKNPFYYRNGILSEISEIDDIHRLLLSEMADSGTKIVLGHYWERVVGLAKKLNRKNIYPAIFYQPRHFPYVAPHNHNSPFGNYIVARQMFDLLNNNGTTELDILKTKDIKTPTKIEIGKRNLCEYADIKIEMNDTVVGYFVNQHPINTDISKKSVFREYNVVSLLAIKRKDDSILDALFVPLDFELTENMPMGIKEDFLGESNYNPVGNVKLLNNNLGIGVINVERLSGGDETFGHSGLMEITPVLNKKSKINIVLGEKSILRTNVGYWDKEGKLFIKLLPFKHNLLTIRPMADSFVDVNELEKTGIVYLSLFLDNGEKIKMPIAQWIKTKKRVYFLDDGKIEEGTHTQLLSESKLYKDFFHNQMEEKIKE